MSKYNDFLKMELKGLKTVLGEGTMKIGIDPGSRSTRSIVYNDKMESKLGVTSIESRYGVAIDDLSDYKSETKYTLEDNLDIIIDDMTPDKDDKLFKKFRFVKEVLRRQTKLVGDSIFTSDTKSRQVPTYLNIIFEIGLKYILENWELEEGIPEECIPTVTLALPPSDAKHQLAVTAFKKKLAGDYRFTMPRYGVSIIINLKPNNILVISEPEAALRYYLSNNLEVAGDAKDIILLDGGGTTSDAVYLENGKLIPKGSIHGDYGGFNIEDNLNNILVSTGKYSKLSIEDVERALEEGFIYSGTAKQPVVKVIDIAKRPIAKNVYSTLMEVLSLNNKRPDSIQKILFAGRMFGTTEFNSEISKSLADIVMEAYRKKSPNTGYYVIEETFPIPEGLMYYEISQNIE